MKFKELQEKSETELRKLLIDQHGALRDFRFRVSAGQEKNVRHGRAVKQMIARIEMLLRSMQKQ